MRLSRANIPLASEDRTHSQAISPSPHYNLAPHFWPGFINLQHFCHSRWRNPVRLSKSGEAERFRSLEINDELECCRLLEWQLGGFLPFENPVHIIGGFAL